jgi:flavin reductase (DIM6/NTAB) family NADH-FMN oxidoreductase RutF
MGGGGDVGAGVFTGDDVCEGAGAEAVLNSVNLLDRGDERTARTLVKPAHRAGDKLGKVGHVEEDTGAPVLRNALSYLEYKVKSISTPGDHAVVIGQVVNAGIHKKGDVMSCEDMRWHYAG